MFPKVALKWGKYGTQSNDGIVIPTPVLSTDDGDSLSHKSSLFQENQVLLFYREWVTQFWPVFKRELLSHLTDGMIRYEMVVMNIEQTLVALAPDWSSPINFDTPTTFYPIDLTKPHQPVDDEFFFKDGLFVTIEDWFPPSREEAFLFVQWLEQFLFGVLAPFVFEGVPPPQIFVIKTPVNSIW